MVMGFWYAPPKKPSHPVYKAQKPDVDKLVRSILDSLTGVVYTDDSQVVIVTAYKKYGAPERVEIVAESL